MWALLLKKLSNPELQRWLFLGLFILSVFFLAKSCSDNSQELAIANHNIVALHDTIHIVKTKNGQLESQKTAFIADNDRLKMLNKELSDELEKEKGNVKVIIKEGIKIKYDTIKVKYMEYEKIDDSTGKFIWAYKEQQPSLFTQIRGENIFQILDGEIKNPQTKITDLSFQLDLITGITEIDDYYKIFVRTKENNPNVSFNVDGSIVDEKFFTNEKRKWFIGPTIGIGISGPINSFKLYPTINWNIGISVGYKLWSF